jgi:hypothetical protein
VTSRTLPCRNCGRDFPEQDLDDKRWCESCRSEVVRRATRWGRAVALLSALLLGLWIALGIGPSERFLVVWMVLVAATYVFMSKLVRRVAFEIIRSRGVPPVRD